MDPFLIRFSQRSIKYRFKDGSSIDDLAEGLRSGRIAPGAIPPVRLVTKDGVYYTLDNRRLEAFRRAGLPVPWRLASEEELQAAAWKFTTTNDGVNTRVRGENA